MTRNKLLCQGQVWKLALIVIVVSKFVPICDVLAQGQIINVKVLVERTHWNGCNDDAGPFSSPPDIYHRVTIDDVELSSRNNPITNNVAPFDVNREFSADVDASQRTIPIIIEEWDEDGGLTGDDDQCNIQIGAGKALNLILDLATCQISGEANGVCGTSIEIETSGIYFVLAYFDRTLS